MQKCEIMLNDLIDSKRTNTNVKATINQLSQTGKFKKVNIIDTFNMILSSLFATKIVGAESREHEVSFDIMDATIISSNFWPPIQV